MCKEDQCEWKVIEIAFGWGPVTYDFTLHTRIRDQHYMVSEVCWDTTFAHFPLGSHKVMVMVMALSSCVEWPFVIGCAKENGFNVTKSHNAPSPHDFSQ
jgi:hypothetical protein